MKSNIELKVGSKSEVDFLFFPQLRITFLSPTTTTSTHPTTHKDDNAATRTMTATTAMTATPPPTS
jgi:hypothetical protein